jgi:hypothetical protein
MSNQDGMQTDKTIDVNGSASKVADLLNWAL